MGEYLGNNNNPYKYFEEDDNRSFITFSPLETKIILNVPNVTSQMRPKKIIIGNNQVYVSRKANIASLIYNSSKDSKDYLKKSYINKGLVIGRNQLK